jgi:HPt (histidine-containing phosphotransfer) domain-containing protein
VSTPASDADGPAVDLSALDELASDLGSVEPVRSIVATYLAELGGRRDLVLASAARSDIDGVRHGAHQLRSTSRTLGASAVDRSAAQVEAASLPLDPDLLVRFDRAVEATREALLGWLSGGPASRS